MQLKVLSFNIAHGSGMNGVLDLERTARVIEMSGAELIGLQEVDRHFSARSDFQDQARWLGKRLGMHVAYGANLDLEPFTMGGARRQYGNAVLSKYPIRYTENHLLTQVEELFGSNEQRGVLETVIDVEDIYISFYSTHLALKQAELGVNIQELLEVTGRSRLPRIITGDFNAPPENQHIQRLSREFKDAFHDRKLDTVLTYPSLYHNRQTGEKTWPATRIDYIFSDWDISIAHAAAIPTDASDHLPIVAEASLVGRPERSAAKRMKN